MKATLTAAVFLVLSAFAAHAQKPSTRAVTPPCTAPCTQQQLLNDIQNQFPDQTSGAITPSVLRTFFTNQVNSMMATSPVVSGDLACYFGTTGLPGTCTGALAIGKGGTGAISQGGALSNLLPAPTRAGDLLYWNGTNWVTLAGNNTGTKVLQQDSTGVSSWGTPTTFPTPAAPGDLIYWSGSAWVSYAGNTGSSKLFMESAAGAPSWVSGATAAALAHPTPTRAGDITYWNGTAWTALAGNNAGTRYLQEDASGAPSWIVPPAAVTSVTCGTGLGGGTITGTGTCTVSLSSFYTPLGADVALNNTANYSTTGPSVAQGPAGTWFASGTVTLTDTVAAVFHCKLWDGTSIVASSAQQLSTAGGLVSITLSGVFASPSGNIRIDCKDVTTTNGAIKFNATGSSKDSSVTAVRIYQ